MTSTRQTIRTLRLDVRGLGSVLGRGGQCRAYNSTRTPRWPDNMLHLGVAEERLSVFPRNTRALESATGSQAGVDVR